MFYLALFSLLSAATYLGCEKSGIPPTEEVLPDSPVTPVPASGALTSRADECEDCPVDDCCCGIELFGSTFSADIELCGTSDGSDSCGPFSPGGGCGTISGGGQSFTLTDVTNPKKLFCMDKNAAFQIGNTSNSSIQIRVTCQENLASPLYDTITIPAQSRIFYQTNGDCELDPC